MPRWRLTKTHYLNAIRDGEPTEWQYEETNRDSGRRARKTFKVGLFLDPESPPDWNYPMEGVIIVAQAPGAMPKDIIFVGDPTPDMEPLDAAAEAISERCRGSWVHPIESLPGQGGYSASLISKFEQMILAIPKAAAVPLGGVSQADFDTLKQMVANLAQQNQALMAELATRQDDAEPLPDVEPTPEELAQAEATVRRR